MTEAASDDPILAAEALNRLCRQYRASIVRWFGHAGLRHADAEDATQEFLTQVFGGSQLKGFARRERRFRSWLLACLRNFAVDNQRVATTVRRGAGAPHLEVTQVDPPASLWPPDAVLDRELALELHAQALAEVRLRWRDSGRAESFKLLAPLLLENPDAGEYARVGRLLDLSPERIKRRVFDLREQYFDRFRARVAAAVEPTELGDELKYLAALLAADPPAVEI